MGTSCCISPPSKPNSFFHPQLEQIYVGQNIELAYPQSQRVLPTKRTSEPSLLPLNNQITKMINTFEKCHGTITNSFTRTNTMLNSMSLAPKIKHHENEISEIMFKPNRLGEKRQIKNILNEKQNMEGLASIKEKRESEVEKSGERKTNSKQNKQNNNGKYKVERRKPSQVSVSKQQFCPRSSETDKKQQIEIVPKIKLKAESAKNIEFENSGSCTWEEDNQQNSDMECENEQQASDFLDKSLINEQICKQKLDLIKQYNDVQNFVLKEWSSQTCEKCSLTVKQLLKCQFDPIYSAALSAIVIYYEKFNISLCAFSNNQHQSLVKLHINGQKRQISLDRQSSPLQLFHQALCKLYSQNQICTTPCNQVYHLSGWVPEVLYLGEIQNKENLWDRLVQNFNDGNIVITFGYGLEVQSYMTLESIDTQTSKLKVICTIEEEYSNKLAIKQVSWQELLQTVESIYINWNPSIYNFVKKIDSKWVSKLLPFENQAISLETNPQYLIKIPRHSQDFQIRVFADRYIKRFSEQSRLSLKLFEYNGSRILSPNEAVRTLQVDSRELISDVFIFEKSQTVDYFVLVILADDDQIIDNQEIAFSLLFLSFVDIEVKQLPRREILQSDVISSKINKQNIGYGLNSPDFFKNIQYSLRVPPESWLQIQVQSTSGCEFTLILVEDKDCQMDLAKIDFETILNESTISEVFEQYGFIQKQTVSQYYILIVALTKCSQNSKFKITANTCSKLFKRNRDLQACYSAIQITQIVFKPEIIKQVDIKWHTTNPGPRKRLKHTSTQVVYHPASIFEDFLKNPHLVLKLEKGNYQFNLVCENYRTAFYKNQHTDGEPPALSIAVLKNSDNNKGYKIVVDDAFYVPIGYGFWTPELTLEEGRYTIVCARVEKSESKGKLRIRKI